jgi:hypothetical protein
LWAEAIAESVATQTKAQHRQREQAFAELNQYMARLGQKSLSARVAGRDLPKFMLDQDALEQEPVLVLAFDHSLSCIWATVVNGQLPGGRMPSALFTADNALR